MQACSRASLAGRGAEATAAPACLPRASLRPVPLPVNRCFVSRAFHGTSLPARCRTRLTPQAAATTAKTGSLAVFGSASGDVFIAGATGPLGARITQELLLSGFKVTAGAADIEDAQGLLDFAKRFELIRKEQSQKLSLTEVDFSDEADIAASLPRRGAKVVIALGDAAGGQRIDARVASRIVEAAQTAGASQLVLVSPSGGGGGGGGGLFGGFLGGGGGSASSVEQEVVNSGIQSIVLRVGATNVDDSLAAQSAIALGRQGSKPAGATIAKSQVAQVVAQALQQADTDVAIEAWAVRDAEPRDLAQLMAKVLPTAVIESAEEEDEEEEDVPQPASALSSTVNGAVSSNGAQAAKGAAGGLFGRVKRTAQEVTGEEEPEEAPKAALGGLFGRARKAAQDTTGEADAEKKPGKALGGLFGRTKRAAEEAIDEIESEPKPKLFAGLLGGTQKVSAKAEQGAKQAARQAASGGTRAARRAQSAAQQTAPSRGGLFGSGKPAPAAEPETGKKAFGSLLGGGKRASKEAQKGGKQVQVSAQQAQKNVKQSAARIRGAAKGAAPEEPGKKQNPLSWLGIGQDSMYADDE